MTKKPVYGFIVLFLSLIILIGIFAGNTGAANQKISGDVRSLMQGAEKVPVIVILNQAKFPDAANENIVAALKSRAAEKQKNLISILEREKGKGNADKIKPFWIVNAIALNASPQLIEDLSVNDDVEFIEPDRHFTTMENYSISVRPGSYATSELIRINATGAWGFGIDGSGMNVSIIDTGIKSSHPDIAGRVIKWADFVNAGVLPYDDDGHGTHVAGIVGGNGAGGTITGAAPNASLFGVKVLDSSGSGMESAIIQGIEWSVDNKADIISMSLGSLETYTTQNCDNKNVLMSRAIDNSIASGVIVVAAAGNSASGVSSPGCIGNAVAVGAVDSNDVIAYFSGRGAAMADHGVVSPGVGITSLNYLTTGYIQYSGTSMATPHVSGTLALMLEAARKKGIVLTPAQAKTILMDNSIDLGVTGKDNTYGAGRIDVFGAVKGYVGRGYINGTVLDRTTRAGVAGAGITINSTTGTVTDDFGFYSLDVMEGDYYLTVTADPGYYPNNSIFVTALKDSTIIRDIEITRKPTGAISGRISGR